MRKIYSIGIKLAIAFLLVFSCSQGIVAKAAAFWDFTPPDVSSIQVDKSTVHAGDTVTLTINAIDNDSNISNVKVWYTDGEGFLEIFEGTYNQQSKQVQIQIPISSASSLGNWKLSKIWFYYDSGSNNIVDSALSGGDFQVLSGSTADPGTGTDTGTSSPLIISSISVNKNQVYQGDSVTLTVNALNTASTIRDVDVWYTDGNGLLNTYDASYNSVTKQVQINIPITTISSLGKWKISSIWFYYTDDSFTTVDPSNSDLSGGNFEVVVKPDVESPVFKGISIDKNQVTLGNSAKVKIAAEDAGSGIAEVNVSYLTPNGETRTSAAAYNWFDDRYEADVPVTDFSNIGNWQVSSVYLKDTKGNDVTIYNSSLYSSGVTTDLSNGNFQAIEDKGDSSDYFANARFYSTNITLSDETINGDVYVGPNAVLTINGNVMINGDLHIFGSYVLSGNLKVNGTLDLTKTLDYVPMYLNNQPLTAINGKLNISGKTVPFVSMTIENQPVSINSDGTFTLNNLDVQGKQGITVKLVDLSGNTILRQFLVNQQTITAPSAPVVNQVSDKDTIVTGSAESGTTITVTAGTKQYTASADSKGGFKVTIAKQKAGTKLIVTATNFAGMVSAATNVSVLDKTAPVAPVVNVVTDQSKEITGTTETGTTVNITIGTKSYTIKADSKGSFKVTIGQQKAGTKIMVTATDAAGNASVVTNVSVLDKTAPAAPVVNVVTDQSKEIIGTTEPGATVNITIGNKTYTVKADTKGSFKITIGQQKAGTKIMVTATDVAGNTSTATNVSVLDKTAPVAPVVNIVTDQSKELTGTTEPGATVNITIGTKTYTIKADTKGSFKVSIAQQKAGTKIVVRAIDLAGNTSAATNVSVLDKTAPVSPVVNIVTDQSKEIIGTTEPGSTVNITIGTKTYTVKADTKGSFKISISQQKAGTKIIVTVTDVAGNTSKATNVSVLDKTAPVAPVVNKVTAQSKEVSGKAEAGSTITVTIGSKKYTAKADTKGVFKVSITQQKAGTKLVVTATDSAGNISNATTITVVSK